MDGNEDLRDRRTATRLFVIIALAVVAAGVVLFGIVAPALADLVAPGIGLQTAAIIAFFLTLAVMVVMAIAAGDGLLGEIQYMLAAFGGFFVISWLMIAWIF